MPPLGTLSQLFQGNTRINDFIQCGFDKWRPSVKFAHEFSEITKANGNGDRILFLHIEKIILQRFHPVD